MYDTPAAISSLILPIVPANRPIVPDTQPVVEYTQPVVAGTDSEFIGFIDLVHVIS
jgi:hypothetical protein